MDSAPYNNVLIESKYTSIWYRCSYRARCIFFNGQVWELQRHQRILQLHSGP